MNLRKIKKWYSHGTAILGRKGTIQRVLSNANGVVQKMAEVHENARLQQFNQVEKSSLAGIERLRSQLLSSDELMHFERIWEPEDSEAFGQEDSIAVKDMARTAAMPSGWGEFHFSLLRSIQAEICLELGSNVGISGAYLASALALNKKGLLVTLEGIESFANVASRGFEQLGLSNVELHTGLFQDTLSGVLQKHEKFDYVFIDGHHQKDPTLEYFDLIKPYLAENAIVVFDDIYWSKGMKEAWDIVSNDENTQAAFDYYKLGLIIFNAKNKQQTDHFRLALYL